MLENPKIVSKMLMCCFVIGNFSNKNIGSVCIHICPQTKFSICLSGDNFWDFFLDYLNKMYMEQVFKFENDITMNNKPAHVL